MNKPNADRTDEEIVALFFERDQRALEQTARKYGKLILSVCRNILQNDEDAEECRNSVYFAVWQSIPPEKPKCFPAFLTRVSRNAAIDMQRSKARIKRRGDRDPLPPEELSDLFADSGTIESKLEEKELARIINRFLGELDADGRRLFVLRFYYEMNTADIAKLFGVSRRSVYMRLDSVKNKFRITLEKEGYDP